jgi:hypothetical protein
LGAEVRELKREGLAASERDRQARLEGKTGAGRFTEGLSLFWDRIKAGNIDEPGSLAYKQAGAGRGRMERENAAWKEWADKNAGKVQTGDNTAEWESGRGPMKKKDLQQDTTSKPSREYAGEYSDIDTMKKRAIIMPELLPKADENAKPNPMGGNPVIDEGSSKASTRKASRSANRRSKAGVANQPSNAISSNRKIVNRSRNPNVKTVSAPSVPADNDSLKSRPGARGGNNDERKSIPIPAEMKSDSSTLSSIPYPAEKAVRNLSAQFQKAENEYLADRLNVAKKRERERAKKAYEDAARALQR